MGSIRTTGKASGILAAAALLAACAATQPPPRAPLQDAEALTRAALAATRMGAGMEVRRRADGQLALVAPGAPVAAAMVRTRAPDLAVMPAEPARGEPAPVAQAAPAAPAVTAQVMIPPVIGQPPASAPAQPASPADRTKEVQQALLAWRLAWELGDYASYVRFYDPAFKGDAGSRAQWEKQRRSRLGNGKIGVKLDNVRTTLVSDSEADIEFVQHYSSGRHSDVGNKRLKMKREGGAWRITEETWTPRR